MEESELKKLTDLMAKLRSPSGCPWDREQDMKSLIPYIVEEAYEVVEAIESNNMENIKEESGDLLFQIVFLARIAREENHFDLTDVINTSIEKMTRRHPHVFGKTKAATPEEALHRWNTVKKTERKDEEDLADISNSLPALMRAQKVSKKASSYGFDWEKGEDVLNKLDEEVTELKESVRLGTKTNIEEEIGDVIFTLVNIARFYDINAEQSLRRCTNRFISRFKHLKELTEKEGRGFKDLSIKEMDEFWETAKKMDSHQTT